MDTQQPIEFSDERRRRGNQGTRFGATYGKIYGGGGNVTTINRRFLTANESAGLNLIRALGFFPITMEHRNNLRDKVIGMPQLSTMNMETLASAIYLLDMANWLITPDFFDQNVDSVLSNLEPDVDTPNRDIILERHRKSILRYIRAIQYYMGEM